MPEYLAPGVYVEEIDTGAKPIEGVSTSTAGMVGVTERGPVDVPILLTSYGEYAHWFGEKLTPAEFGEHCYLPYAVDGFFTNGGKRLYLTRVLDTDGAVAASAELFDRGDATSADTVLLRPAGESTGTVANAPLLYVLDVTDLTVDGDIRIGNGSTSEYRAVAVIGASRHVPLSFPLNLSHTTGAADNVEQLPRSPDTANFTAGFTLAQAADAGDQAITVTGAAADITALGTLASPLLEIGASGSGEHRFTGTVTALSTTQARIELNGGALVMDYPVNTVVTPLDVTPAGQVATLTPNATAGDRLTYVNTVGTLDTQGDLVIVDRGDPTTAEVRRIGALSTIDLATGACEEYPAASVVETVTMDDDDRSLAAATAVGDTTITLTDDDVASLRAGSQLLIDPGANEETATIQSIDTTAVPNVITLSAALVNAHAAAAPVVPDFSRKTITTTVAAGQTVIWLANRVSLAVGDVLRIGDDPEDEYIAIGSLPNQAATGADPGNVVLEHPLVRTHAGTQAHPVRVRRQNAPVAGVAQPTVLVLEAVEGAQTLLVSDGTGFAADAMLRVTTATGEQFFHRAAAAAVVAAPAEVTLDAELNHAHDAGAPVVGRDPLIALQALDAGSWGNRLRISVEDESPGLVSRTTLQTVVDPTHIRLASASGVEPGTVLEFLDPLDDDAVVGDPVKVDSVNRQANFTITLAGTGLDAAQQAAHAAAVAAGERLGVRSREFRITVHLLHQLDPARPSRNDLVIGRELFRNLSLDSRHSRYLHTIIGDTDGAVRHSDRRPEGESWYIRVHDLAQDLDEPDRTTTLESVRLGPETLVDLLPSGRRRPARHPLAGGDDSLGTLTDEIYIGEDNTDPDLRTGLFSLVNVDEISILAAPGRTDPTMQNALITQCENLRYRFTVLDGPQPEDDTIPDVQNLRQQYDTRYAGLYYPWLLIDDPFPRNVQEIGTFAVPPSGHVMGIYARTDIDRGVHKSPANEVVRGIIGLRRTINKAEQEILNPYPSNINVIRDFRPNNRAIRVWGGRVITSDPDWKYVNVRRLLIFIEKSIDLGLQWVVFEPNADPLWARVRRTISNFLTTVWRNGALEGTKREEAFFVKCDRTTMTQTDIDNGRLIVIIGVAPVKPAEFVIIRIGLWTAHAED